MDFQHFGTFCSWNRLSALWKPNRSICVKLEGYRIDSEVSLDSLMFGYLCLVFSSCYSAFQHDVSAITANSGLSFPKSEPKPNFEVDHREFYFWSSNFWSKKNIKVCTGAVPQKIVRGLGIDSGMFFRASEKISAQFKLFVFTNKERERSTLNFLYSGMSLRSKIS